MITRVIYLAFNLYALGLVVFAITTWIDVPRTRAFCARVARFYDPLLKKMPPLSIPAKDGKVLIDFKPLLLLVGIIVVREIVVFLVSGL